MLQVFTFQVQMTFGKEYGRPPVRVDLPLRWHAPSGARIWSIMTDVKMTLRSAFEMGPSDDIVLVLIGLEGNANH